MPQNPCCTGICESQRSRVINSASFPDLGIPTTSAMLRAYIPILLFVVIATGFAVFTLVFSRLISAEKSNPVKLQPYECGIEPITDARDRYSIRYYLIAML